MLEFFSSENCGSEKPFRFWEVYFKIKKIIYIKCLPQCHIFSINIIFTVQHEYSSTLSRNDPVCSAYKHCNINNVEINLILKIRPSEHSLY